MKRISRRQLLAAMELFFIAGVGRNWIKPAAAEAMPATSLGPSFFVKGVYQQPVEKMGLWKARGVNTIFTLNDGAKAELWTQAAIREGLYVVREPLGVDDAGEKPSFRIVDKAAFEKDASEPRLLAFALVDEPSNLRPGGAGVTYDGVSWRPDEIDAIARGWAIGRKPVWINHVGNHINNIHLDGIMSDYADSPVVDWLSQDCYPIATGGKLLLDIDGYTSTPQGHAIDRLARWSGGKPQFSFVGLTRFDETQGRETTPSEFLVQAWSSVIHGATGIIYFPFKLRPEFSYDATPPRLVSALESFHSDIDAIEPILMDRIKGGRQRFSILKCSRDPAAFGNSGLPYPFEACVTRTEDGEHKIVLNLSNKPARLTYPAWNLVNVPFGPYQCRRGYDAADLARD